VSPAATAAERVERILSILPHLLEYQGRTVAELAERFDVPPDELRADLELCFYRVGVHPFTPDALVDVLIDSDDDTVTVHVGDYFRRPLRLTPEEALTLVAAGRAVLRSQGDDADPRLAAAVDKLTRVLGPGGTSAVEVRLGEGDAEVLRTVQDAVAERRRLRLDYYSHGRDERTCRDVDPWSVRSEEGHWYLTGWCHQAGGRRVFRLDRVASAEPTGEHFDPPVDAPAEPDLDLADAAASVELVVPPSASWVADAYPTEEVERLEDGRVRIVLRVAATPWLERLLLRLPPEVEALELDSSASLAPLRARAAARLLERYR
jgi:proteasome accessory factor C